MSDLDGTARVAIVLLATYFLHSTCLLAAVWLGLSVFRVRNVLVVEQLWKMAAVAGLATAPLQVATEIHPAIEIAIGEAPLSTAEPSRRQLAPTLRAQSRVTHRPSTRSPIIHTYSAPETHGPLLRETPELRRTNTTLVGRNSIPKATGWQPLSRHAAAAVAACLFTLIALARLSLQLLQFRRCLRECTPIDSGPSRHALDDLLKSANIRRFVRLESSTQLNEPVACGVWRWRIVLPHGINRRLTDGELRALLAHELAHLVRGDTTWLWIGRVLCGCFAFQPLNFVARRRWQRAAEFLSDDWAVRHNAEPLALANCLTQIAEWQLDRRQLAEGLAATGGSAAITERVERLVNAPSQHVGSGRTWVPSLLVAGAAILMTVAGPRASWHLAAAGESPQPADTSSVDRRAVAEDLSRALAELEQCQRLLADASTSELRELVSRLRHRGEVLRDHYTTLSFSVHVSESE